MKNKLIIIALIFISFLLLAFTNSRANSFPLFGKVIFLDPGHGGADPGSIYKEEYEKDYNLDFSFVLKNTLERYGACVIMTREGDYDLASPNATRRKKNDFDNRIKLINEMDADLYLSLHMNYLENTSENGSQVFYDDVSSSNETIAKYMQEALNKFQNEDRPYKKISSDKYMYNKIKVPGVLIEYGFMSSQKDRNNLKRSIYKQNLAEVISKSIIDYFT